VSQKYRSNDFLNLCAICEVQNVDSGTMFRTWCGDFLNKVYATNDLITWPTNNY